jgi:hypothetical protein
MWTENEALHKLCPWMSESPLGTTYCLASGCMAWVPEMIYPNGFRFGGPQDPKIPTGKGTCSRNFKNGIA